MSWRPIEPHWWQIGSTTTSCSKNLTPHYGMFGTTMLETMGPLGTLVHEPQEIGNEHFMVRVVF